ncbi:MAG: DUF4041 domain-containing protein [Anaerostipes sp.]|nr:DUF4041 domain-containing protein [Anaerostipes sp.]
MGLSDILNASKIKKENEQLKKLLTPELQNALNLQKKIDELTDKESELSKSIDEKNVVIEKQNNELSNLKEQVITFNDEILVQEYGLYQPRYSYLSSDKYKDRLSKIRTEQKELIKSSIAASGNTNWTVNNSKAQGKKMVKDTQKLLLRAFNSECDETIGKVKYNNFEASKKKIIKSAEQIQKLGNVLGISVSKEFIDSKIDELYLSFEYQLKKQEEKEKQRELRAQQREEAKLKKEIEEQRKKIEKEKKHYKQAMKNILDQIKANGESDELLLKKSELEKELGDIEISLKDIDYREANQRAGYVYVISNIGAFGDDVYKIGMTRRLNPQDRVDELGDASVPFKFDVHAMIFSDDAPSLESALHQAFENKKLNMVNTRREFFHVSLEEIKNVVKNNFDKTVEFVEFPDADQYRTSLKIKESLI